MRPLLILTIICLLAAACHKKNTAPTAAYQAVWQLSMYKVDNPLWQTIAIPYDSRIQLNLQPSGRVLTYNQSKQLSETSYTLTVEAAPYDSILNFTKMPVLMPDSALRLGLHMQLNIYHSDSMVLSSYPITPAGREYFIFRKTPNLPD
ncbi:MAG: hypothetical protein JST68_20690 [Bacteroidetes bacterium]|nr:hypothetical protein [Bacteroidota bacterium]